MTTVLTNKLTEQIRKRINDLPIDKFVYEGNKYKVNKIKVSGVFPEDEYANDLSDKLDFNCVVEASLIDNLDLSHNQRCTFSGSAKIENFEVTDIDSTFILTPSL